MQVIDIMLLIPILFGAYKGYQKGFIMELIQVVAFVLGIVVGLKLIHLGVYYLKPYTGDLNGWLPVISFLTIFIGTIFLAKWAGKVLKKFVKAVLLGWLDKLMGAILSMLKWAIALSFILWAARSVNLTPHGEPIVYNYLIPIGPAIVDGIGSIIPYASDIFEYIKNV